MSAKEKLYEGKAKILYKGSEPNTIIQYFKDDATAFNAEKRGTIHGKGVINNLISEYMMKGLERVNIPTHFIERTSMREQVCRHVEIIPVEIIVRNVAAGSICKRLGLVEGTPLDNTLVEYCYKSDELGDPVIAAQHATTLGWAEIEELEDMTEMAHRINDYMSGLFAGIGIHLIDFKIEFGRYFLDDENYMVILADEISPDGCRLWDLKTGEKLDKDRFRRDLGGEEEAYQEVARRLGILPDEDVTEITDSRE